MQDRSGGERPVTSARPSHAAILGGLDAKSRAMAAFEAAGGCQ